MLDIVLVLAIIGASLALFVSERVRIDLVAVLVLVALMGIGLFRESFPTPEEALSGFSNKATVTVGAMFILSSGLVRTGAIDQISRRIVRLGGHSANRSTLLLLLWVGCLSAFINNTATLAIFLPIALSVSRQYEMSPSKILMPLSYVAIVGGTCTLIGTSTNIIVSEVSYQHGLGAFPMFELAKLGIGFFVIGLLYSFFVARRILPARAAPVGLTGNYRLSSYLAGMRVNEDSPVAGRTPGDLRLSERYDVNILQITREGEQRWFGLRDTKLQVGDRLLVRGDARDIVRLKETEGLSTTAEAKFRDQDLASDVTAVAEAVISPTSSLVGQTLRGVNFRQKYRVFALALRKHGRTIRRKIADIRLDVGDTLLLQGGRGIIDSLANDPDFLILNELEVPQRRSSHAPVALGIIVLVVVLAAMGVLPIVLSAIIGCVLMVALGCVSLKDAYESVDWMVIFLLAGFLPLGIAMEKTGTAAFLVGGVVDIADLAGPAGVVSALFLLTSILTSLMSNNATAILLSPIGISAAHQLDVSPWPFLMAITYGASAAFATPVGYQTNLMVYSPGAYRFKDYVRAGVPLNLIFWILATFAIPLIWPF